ncbi:MAG: hypothetical protein Q9159_005276 [Coniocarpon cinnabarinum]
MSLTHDKIWPTASTWLMKDTAEFFGIDKENAEAITDTAGDWWLKEVDPDNPYYMTLGKEDPLSQKEQSAQKIIEKLRKHDVLQPDLQSHINEPNTIRDALRGVLYRSIVRVKKKRLKISKPAPEHRSKSQGNQQIANPHERDSSKPQQDPERVLQQEDAHVRGKSHLSTSDDSSDGPPISYRRVRHKISSDSTDSSSKQAGKRKHSSPTSDAPSKRVKSRSSSGVDDVSKESVEAATRAVLRRSELRKDTSAGSSLRIKACSSKTTPQPSEPRSYGRDNGGQLDIFAILKRTKALQEMLEAIREDFGESNMWHIHDHVVGAIREGKVGERNAVTKDLK